MVFLGLESIPGDEVGQIIVDADTLRHRHLRRLLRFPKGFYYNIKLQIIYSIFEWHSLQWSTTVGTHDDADHCHRALRHHHPVHRAAHHEAQDHHHGKEDALPHVRNQKPKASVSSESWNSYYFLYTNWIDHSDSCIYSKNRYNTKKSSYWATTAITAA